MVQAEPSLQLTLKHVSRCGAVLPTESLSALDHSLPIKRAEAGIRSLTVWGRITTRSGKVGDLPQLEPEAAARAARIRTMLTGDPAFQYSVRQVDPALAAPGEAGAAAEGDESGGPKATVTEAQRLRAMVDAINELGAVQPQGCCVANAHGQLVVNKLFSGLEHPDKLESFQHRGQALVPSVSLAQDVRGSWSVAADTFTGVTTLRSLIYPGYFFYYDNRGLTWGSFYSGDGLRNNDLVFML